MKSFVLTGAGKKLTTKWRYGLGYTQMWFGMISEKWISGFHSKKLVAYKVLTMCGMENDHFVLVRLDCEDEDTWATRTRTYFDKVTGTLEENKTLTVKGILDWDKKYLANNDENNRISKKMK